MITLKKILNKYCDMPEYYQYKNEINAFKEWLQQKQGMNISGHIWLSKEELLEELK